MDILYTTFRTEMAQYQLKSWELFFVLSVSFSEILVETCDVLGGLNPGQDEIDEMIEETDKDHSGAIDFRQVLVAAS